MVSSFLADEDSSLYLAKAFRFSFSRSLLSVWVERFAPLLKEVSFREYLFYCVWGCGDSSIGWSVFSGFLVAEVGALGMPTIVEVFPPPYLFSRRMILWGLTLARMPEPSSSEDVW